jgi:peptidoglycan-associated lipoprotein
MKQTRMLMIMLAAAVMLLQGCTGMQAKDEEAALEEGISREGEMEGAEAASAAMAGEFSIEALSDPESPLSNRVFYFEYDSSELKDEDKAILEKHAQFITLHPEISVVVEGHADERGTREYNLALAERRAKAAERLLTLQGVLTDQLQVISFGEERPVALGHDEDAWHLNRRVELLYSGY